MFKRVFIEYEEIVLFMIGYIAKRVPTIYPLVISSLQNKIAPEVLILSFFFLKWEDWLLGCHALTLHHNHCSTCI
jgi:hypothetical protein